ncbi:MAG: aldehyde dehydrogenase family protein [Candidatus Woesearchaeota archaeon]
MVELISTNPAKNYEVLGKVEVSSSEKILEKVKLANKVKLLWKETSIKERIALLKPIYEDFNSRKEELALLITREMGKPITDSRGEVSGFLTEWNWFFENAEKALAEEITFEGNNSKHKIVYEPLGTTAVITPWNYPFGMFVWGVVPNLLAGNPVVFKISEECPLTGKLIEQVMTAHDLPSGVFSEVYGAGEVGQRLANSKIDLIWFTGSTKVGKLLYKIAAKKFIRVVLEMGGSNPAIVFENVNVSEIINTIYSGRFGNCGQVCDALKRLIVHESLFEEVVEKLKQRVERVKLGSPEDPKTEMGSLVAKRQLLVLQDQVKDALEKGAKLITGGKALDLGGAFYEPTILTHLTPKMRVWKEEVFGPVLPIVAFKTEKQALKLANDTPYGLGSRVFSKDLERARRVASKIEAGVVEINNADHWLTCNPFGGYKNSGMGRELGLMGFKELCQVKVISE